MAANWSSEPPRYSPTATATSLADLTTIARIAESTSMLSPRLKRILVGGCRAALSETGICVALVTRPDSSASNSR